MSDLLPVAALAIVLAFARWVGEKVARGTAHQLTADAAPTQMPALPPDTLIEIGDAVFTPEETSKIVSLRDYWQGREVAHNTAPLPHRGNGTGGAA